MTELREQMVRDRRYRSWVTGASSSIKSGAIGDAFDMITEDEWATVNEEDENSIRMLAQNLAERKEYLAASPVGAGSGGSKNPVMGLAANKTSSGAKTNTQGSRPTMHFKKSRPLWKKTENRIDSRSQHCRVDCDVNDVLDAVRWGVGV